MKATHPKPTGPAPQLFAPVRNSNVEGAGAEKAARLIGLDRLRTKKCAKSQIDWLSRRQYGLAHFRGFRSVGQKTQDFAETRVALIERSLVQSILASILPPPEGKR
ncbi:MAG: hypothetical protein E5V89_24265 [Mesorhizobium sp.]|nr:MAG: hypothetical protein E5V89_24265 [Mesorhizobium sp.]